MLPPSTRNTEGTVTSGDDPDRPSEGSSAVALRLPALGPTAAGALSLMVVASLFFLPILGPLVAPLGAIPVLRLAGSGRTGARAWGWVLAVLLAALMVPMLRPVVLLLTAAYLLLVVIPVSTVELAGQLGWSEGRWVAVAVLSGAVVALGAVAATAWPAGPVEGTRALFQDFLRQAEELYREQGVDSVDLGMAIDQAEQRLSWFLPGLVVLYQVWALFWVRPRLALLGIPLRVGRFEDYRSEVWLPLAFAVAGAATLIASGTLRWAALNLLGAVVILFFVHGLAIIRAHLARWFGRGWHLRLVAALLCLLAVVGQQLVPVALVAGLGLADSFFDLRPHAEDDREST